MNKTQPNIIFCLFKALLHIHDFDVDSKGKYSRLSNNWNSRNQNFFWYIKKKKKKNQRNSTLNVAPKPSTLISPNLVPATSSDPDDPGAAYPVKPISLLQQF